jgi:phage-related protein
MTAPAFPSINISQQSSKMRKNRVLIAQFGGGYGQYAKDGLNSQYDEWSLVLQNLTSTERATVNTFYETVGSDVWFTWTAPGDSSSKKWRIMKDTFRENPVSGNLYTINMTIQQQFDLG